MTRRGCVFSAGVQRELTVVPIQWSHVLRIQKNSMVTKLFSAVEIDLNATGRPVTDTRRKDELTRSAAGVRAYRSGRVKRSRTLLPANENNDLLLERNGLGKRWTRGWADSVCSTTRRRHLSEPAYCWAQ
jgi:hypothetical protein